MRTVFIQITTVIQLLDEYNDHSLILIYTLSFIFFMKPFKDYLPQWENQITSSVLLQTFAHTISKLSISSPPLVSPHPLLQLIISTLKLYTRSAFSMSFQAPRAMLHVYRIKLHKLSVVFLFRRKRESQFVIKIPAWSFRNSRHL